MVDKRKVEIMKETRLAVKAVDAAAVKHEKVGRPAWHSKCTD